MKDNFNISDINQGGENNNLEVKNIKNRNRENSIDKRKTVVKVTNTIENRTPLAFFNPYNKNAIPYNSLPYVNDRHTLKKYFNALEDSYGDESVPIKFYAFVANKLGDNRYVLTNVIDEFGNLVASHVNIFETNLSRYVHELISFGGVIYKYNESDENELIEDEEIEEEPNVFTVENETKYSIDILENDYWKIQIVKPNGEYFDKPIWRILYNENKNYVNICNEIEKYMEYSSNDILVVIDNIKSLLNEISHKMFGIPNMIYPTILNTFLMRDDVEDQKVILNNHLHINKICTIVTSYIINLNPKSYFEVYKIILYVVLNCMGYEIDSPGIYGKTRLYAVTDSMSITRKNVNYYLKNFKSNSGGLEEITKVIPNYLKTNSDKINALAMQEFALRIKFCC